MFNKENFTNFVKKSEKFQETQEMKYVEKETRKEIFNFQDEKERVIVQMHELLKKTDAGEEISFEEKDLISVGYENGKYKTFGKKGGEISKGDIAVASMWGKNLKLNSEVDRKTKKEFILRESKKRISSLWDKQINLAVQDTDSEDVFKLQAFNGLKKSADAESKMKYEEMSSGHIAEKMVDSFMTKILVNNPDFPFTMEQADTYDDVNEKMDFIFHIKKEYSRGLNIKSCEEESEKDCEKNDIGVQYTMNTDPEVQNKKINQIDKSKKRNIDKVDDIILVTVPLGKIQEVLKKFKEKKRDNNFSGPEQFLNMDIKRTLFKSMLENLPENLNINAEEYWKKIEDQITKLA